jgi:uncharacterized protein YidB (DUF937 family)
MGFLDAILGNMMGGPQGSQQRALIAMVLQMLQQSGGLQGLLRQMQGSGYGEQAQSWIGTGQNMPITPDILAQILGQNRVHEMAQQLGMSDQDAAGRMAEALPDVVDRMTPQGRIADDQDDLVARTLEELTRGRR